VNAHAVDEGSGWPVLCLHGIGSSSVMFDSLRQALAPDYRVITWDAPGYGKSRASEVPHDLKAFADAALAGIDERDIEAVHVVGVSWGAAIGLRLAMSHPERVRSLTLISPTLGYRERPDRAEALRTRAEELAEIGPVEFAGRRAGNLVAPTTRADVVARIEQVMSEALTQEGYWGAVESLANADLAEELASISVPCLIICGRLDDVTGPSEGERALRSLRDAALVIVDEAGHLNLLERPASVHAWLLAHLDIADGCDSTEGEGL
jgi:pimeloyl-ACP methyl ester carboxylesterase